MATRPQAFRFYQTAFRDGVRRLTMEQIGAYVLLLCEQFEVEFLPTSRDELMVILNCDNATFDRIWDKLEAKFELTEDGYQNARMAEEREAIYAGDNGKPPTKKKSKKSTDSTDESRLETADISRVIAWYQGYHPQARPGDRERSLVSARLKEGYACDDLLKAIDGCHVDPFYCGENEQGKKYQSLGLIIRDSRHVAQFMEAWDERNAPVMSEKERRGMRASDNIGKQMGELFDESD